MLSRLLRFIFFALFVRPLLFFYVGVNARHRERLPENGPAIVIANHNSHLDTLALLTLFRRRVSRKLRPVAAADYFMRYRWLAWFSTRIIGIIPLARKPGRGTGDPFEECSRALLNGDILILFPEGSRGEPERLSTFKGGLARLVERHPAVPVYPVFLHGLGKALPRGEFILVPFQCDALIGEPIFWNGARDKFMELVHNAIAALQREGDFAPYE